MEISWAVRVRNGEVLLRVKEDRNILIVRYRWKANWISHILCRDCLLKHFIESMIEGRIDVEDVSIY